MQPGGSLIACGNVCWPPKLLKAVRQSVFDNIEAYVSIVEDPAFRCFFPVVGDDFLKTFPKGFPRDFKYAEYLKCKEYACSCPVPDSFFLRPDVWERMDEVFRQCKRFNDFINYTVDDFEE